MAKLLFYGLEYGGEMKRGCFGGGRDIWDPYPGDTFG